jgi:uncharacterized membrane protein YedE/YeeE
VRFAQRRCGHSGLIDVVVVKLCFAGRGACTLETFWYPEAEKRMLLGSTKLGIGQGLFEFCTYSKGIRPRAQVSEIQVLLLPGNDP